MAVVSTPSRNGTKPATIRCAIYVRISVDDAPDSAFGSTEAQREAAIAYITSQRHDGWEAIPDVYEDRGFSGGTTNRPAFQRLLRDVGAGRVDRVVVHRIDRLSRSLADFGQTMKVLERYGVGLVSVTQQIDTSTASGRLMLNVLGSFAEFEREMIAERTRDKIRAARRRGRWTGGIPMLGYDVVKGTGLVANEAEAERVRAIFRLYMDRGSLSATVAELRRRRWPTKRWKNGRGVLTGGRAFSTSSLQKMLSSPLYLGKIRCEGEVVEAEHEAIVDTGLYEAVQAALEANRVAPTGRRRTSRTALLAGLLHCSCGARMTQTGTTRKGRRYAYYHCPKGDCLTRPVPAGEFEAAVIAEIARVGLDPELIEATYQSARDQAKARVRELENDLRMLEAEVAQRREAGDRDAIRDAEKRRRSVEEQLAAARRCSFAKADVAEALTDFDALWQHLTAEERHQVLALLVERIEYDGETGDLGIRIRDEAATLMEEAP